VKFPVELLCYLPLAVCDFLTYCFPRLSSFDTFSVLTYLNHTNDHKKTIASEAVGKTGSFDGRCFFRY
jgi:hypothetical protein